MEIYKKQYKDRKNITYFPSHVDRSDNVENNSMSTSVLKYVKS